MSKFLLKTSTMMVLLSAILLSGCAKKKMEKLSSDTPYPDFNKAYWAKEKEAKTPWWSQALAYCQAHSEKINCGPLLEYYFLSSGSTKIPKYGTVGSISIPNV